MEKIIILGRPGSGKTTLSRKLSQALNLPLFHLDKYVVDEYGNRIPQEDFIRKQEELMQGDTWIIDGNWAYTISYRVKKADTIIIFDFPLYISLMQYIKRVLTNFNKVRPESGGGIKTRFRWHAIKSIINYPRVQVFSTVEQYKHNKKVYIFRSRKDVTTFLKKINL